ncbi:hypothetical protein DNTS_034518 [Danionella cerebrum]|uniref:Suppressor APC domain-containing protein n=1 Tax=Danionella cerebrum TaxID=2873325 RepID=A0A553MPK6_9TELE|nr:hypothetical protein DNTS_034518 [Danionella translucida]
MALIHSDNRARLINTLRRNYYLVSELPTVPPADAELNHGLPKAFLQSLRTLFDILDDERRGFVHLSEIESRWVGAEQRDLPTGVLQSLRRVAPRDGRLSFERFVAGLRSSIISPEITLSQQPEPLQQKPDGMVRPLGSSNGTNRRNRLRGSSCLDSHGGSVRCPEHTVLSHAQRTGWSHRAKFDGEGRNPVLNRTTERQTADGRARCNFIEPPVERKTGET